MAYTGPKVDQITKNSIRKLAKDHGIGNVAFKTFASLNELIRCAIMEGCFNAIDDKRTTLMPKDIEPLIVIQRKEYLQLKKRDIMLRELMRSLEEDDPDLSRMDERPNEKEDK